MKVLIILAHPEPKSLNASLFQLSVNEFKAQGHEVKTSDLYSMNWKAVLDRHDFPSLTDTRLKPTFASKEAFTAGTLTEDVKTEQEKLLWADFVLFHFPLYWFTMPAILKGWVERVFSFGFGYGVGDHNEKNWGHRYGQGTFAGKRAMLVVTIGGWEEQYSDRGISGPTEDMLYPINHGVLFYPGFQVLPSHVIYKTHRLDDADFEREAERYRKTLRQLDTIEPIPFRRQNDGEYDIPSCRLKPGLEGDNKMGFALHIHDTDVTNSN
ncbi:hypothetical protein HG530_013931 [Fusarium avenaceum]|nr:hypothetical protein HG530_013931 [Fusarium avenaceum]